PISRRLRRGSHTTLYRRLEAISRSSFRDIRCLRCSLLRGTGKRHAGPVARVQDDQPVADSDGDRFRPTWIARQRQRILSYVDAEGVLAITESKCKPAELVRQRRVKM